MSSGVKLVRRKNIFWWTPVVSLYRYICKWKLLLLVGRNKRLLESQRSKNYFCKSVVYNCRGDESGSTEPHIILN